MLKLAPGLGAMVAEPERLIATEAELLDIFAASINLKSSLARRSAEQASRFDLIDLDKALRQKKEAATQLGEVASGFQQSIDTPSINPLLVKTTRDHFSTYIDFFSTLRRANHNPWRGASDLITEIEVLPILKMSFEMQPAFASQSTDQLYQIVEAIRARDPQQAATVMQQHMLAVLAAARPGAV